MMIFSELFMLVESQRQVPGVVVIVRTLDIVLTETWIQDILRLFDVN